MKKLYDQTREKGRQVFHGQYSLYHFRKTNALFATAFDGGAIRLIISECPVGAADASVTVLFDDGQIAKWETKWISVYNYQFGVAASFDGAYIFIQTWGNGLFCIDAHTGETVWRTKSKRGITNIFVNESTLVIHQRERALQLIDIHTGEIIKEKRPATAWGFTAINHKRIVCQVTARRWEIIDTDTLEPQMAFSHREFTGGHDHHCINGIRLEGQELVVRGFRNVWDNTAKPVKLLANHEFEHRFPVEL